MKVKHQVTYLTLRAVAFAVSVAVLVLNTLGLVGVDSSLALLATGFFAFALSSFVQPERVRVPYEEG